MSKKLSIKTLSCFESVFKLSKNIIYSRRCSNCNDTGLFTLRQKLTKEQKLEPPPPKISFLLLYRFLQEK